MIQQYASVLRKVPINYTAVLVSKSVAELFKRRSKQTPVGRTQTNSIPICPSIDQPSIMVQQQQPPSANSQPIGASSVSVATIIAALQALGLVVPNNEDFVVVPGTAGAAPAPPPATSSTPPVTCPHVCATCQTLEEAQVEAASSSSTTADDSPTPNDAVANDPPTVVASTSAGPSANVAATASYRPAADIWYAVIVGRKVGVVQGWVNVEALVNGVSGSRFRRGRSGTHQEAAALFEQALEDGAVEIRG
ncbi:hypothetical protein H0H93_013167 [Arthromyces matolae]|nr:hypothetical protein H0H93_013167 [Arthromyces matolae]